MKKYLFFLSISIFALSFNISAQTENQVQAIQVENISDKLTDISKSLNSLNERLTKFSETFSSNQGLKLSESQQTILAAFEYLNRAEQRLATLQKLKIELSEKQSSVRLQVSDIEEQLRPESIDRSVTFRGTTKTEELRESRRQALNKEKTELNTLISDIQNSLNETNNEIRQTEQFLRRIRQRIFPAIEREISDL